LRHAGQRLAFAVAAGLTLLAVALHVVVFLNAGGLWRDEISAVALGSMPLREAWASLPFDSMPMGFVLLLQAVCRLGLASDTVLRGVGLLLGLLLLAALWFAARRFAEGPPLVSLLLFGLCPSVLRYGDSVRAYGLGSALGIATLALLWDALHEPTRRRVAVASMAAAIAIQFHYQNAILLAAGSAGGLALALVARRRARLTAIVAIAVAALLSLSCYLGRVLATREAVDVQHRPLGLALVARNAALALLTSRASYALWLALLCVPLVAIARGAATGERERPLFLLTTLAAALVGYPAFVVWTGYEPNPWHYIPFFATLAVTLDGLAAALVPASRLAIASALAAAALAPSAWAFAHGRHTNVDRIAALLAERAGDGDIIVVSPYYYGISFGRYYRGAARWMALPNGDQPRLHRTDRVREAMLEDDAIAPVRARVDEALDAGQRVFLVLDGAILDLPPPSPPPVPDPVWGWNADASFRFWGLALGYHLQRLNPRREPIEVPGDDAVGPYERMQLIEVWRPRPPGAPG
jgi:hypothetical protein